MQVFTRFIKIVDPEIISILEEGRKAYADRVSRVKEVLSEVPGIDLGHVMLKKDGALVAFKILDGVDMSILKKVPKIDGGWNFRRNKKEGRQLSDRIRKIPKVPNADALALDAMGVNHVYFVGMRVYWPRLVYVNYPDNCVVLSLPWADVDPDMLQKYKGGDPQHDSDYELMAMLATWEPPEGSEALKEWECQRLIEGHNDHVVKSSKEN